MPHRLLCLLPFLACCPVDAAGDRLRIGVYALPPGMGNPHTQADIPGTFIWPAVLEPLTVVDADGEVRPHLARAWQALDETTWRFELRRDVRFSNGERLDAEAVAATVEWLLGPEGRRLIVHQEVANVARVETPDAHTVVIHTAEPDAMLPRNLSVVRITPPRYWAEVGPAGFARAPVGTGPYEVVRWGDSRVTMRRHPGAWRPAQIDELEFIALPEAPSRVQGIQSGALDIAMQLGPDDGPAIRAAGATLETRPMGSVMGLSFITTRPSPLTDRRVRLALNLAVDRELMVREIFHGTTEVADQHASPLAFGFHPELEPYPHDPDRARELLAEAGYPEGFRFTAQVVVGAGAGDSAVYQYVAAELRRIGVDMQLRVMPTPVLLRNIYEGTWLGEAFGMNFSNSPYLDGWKPFRLHSCLWMQPWFCPEDLTDAILEARTTFDLEAREARVRELVAEYHERVPMLLLYRIKGYDAVAPRVRGYRNVMGVIDFQALHLAEEDRTERRSRRR